MSVRSALPATAVANLSLGVSLLAFACSVLGLLVTVGAVPPLAWPWPAASEPVPSGWYDWADASDRPVLPPAAAESYARTGTWTGARCLCGSGFEAGYAKDRATFVVTKAPDGYADTLGKRFRSPARVCLNCAD